jgi:hypothetical protein
MMSVGSTLKKYTRISYTFSHNKSNEMPPMNSVVCASEYVGRHDFVSIGLANIFVRGLLGLCHIVAL